MGKLGVDTAFNGDYTNAKGESVSLYIGYFASPYRKYEGIFAHTPNNCLPATGWQITKIEKYRLKPVYGSSEGMTINSIRAQKEGTNSLVYFWFQSRNGVFTNPYVNQLALAMNALRNEFTPVVVLRVITPIYDGESEEQASTRADTFVRDIERILVPTLKNL